MYFNVLGCEDVDWNHMDQNMVQLRDFMFIVIKILSLNMADISWPTTDRQFPSKGSALKWIYDVYKTAQFLPAQGSEHLPGATGISCESPFLRSSY